MSPTIFREGGYRFYFFSREEPRIHVHVYHADGEAKHLLDPGIELAQSHGLTRRQLTAVVRIVGEHEDEIRATWATHFRS